VSRSVCEEGPLKSGPEGYLPKFSEHHKPAGRFLQAQNHLLARQWGSKQLTAKVLSRTVHRDVNYRQCPELLAV